MDSGLVCLLVSLVNLPTSAWDFGVIPRHNRTITLPISHAWDYAPGFYGSADAVFETLDETNEGRADNMMTSTSIRTREWSIGTDLIGLRWSREYVSFGAALFEKYINLHTDETAVYTADEGYQILPCEISLTLTNVRNLGIFLPVASVRPDYSEGPIPYTPNRGDCKF